jgi:hypothetical protein
MAREGDPPRDPDVEIGAVARAKRLRFKKKPRVDVTTRSTVEVDPDLADEVRIEGEGGSRAEREDLPDEVEPGVTYRDVKVGWRAGARVRRRDDDAR